MEHKIGFSFLGQLSRQVVIAQSLRLLMLTSFKLVLLSSVFHVEFFSCGCIFVDISTCQAHGERQDQNTETFTLTFIEKRVNSVEGVCFILQPLTKYLKLFYVLAQFPFIISEMEPGYQQQKLNVRVVSRLAKRLKTQDLILGNEEISRKSQN